ncbi:MAG: helix-turn-helix domain-containing protein, partial [Actinomycetota bacterium]
MPARSYGQFCGLARALEHVGDRWTLLIVRQLLTSPRRYVDLRRALGTPTNVLADRLRRLADDGIVESTILPAPARTPVWALTEGGRDLEPVVLELLRFGARYLADPERIDEPAHDEWVVFPLRWLARRAPVPVPERWRFQVGDDPVVTVSVDDHAVELVPDFGWVDLTIRAAGADRLAAVLSGTVPVPGDLDLVGARDAFVDLVR